MSGKIIYTVKSRSQCKRERQLKRRYLVVPQYERWDSLVYYYNIRFLALCRAWFEAKVKNKSYRVVGRKCEEDK